MKHIQHSVDGIRERSWPMHLYGFRCKRDKVRCKVETKVAFASLGHEKVYSVVQEVVEDLKNPKWHHRISLCSRMESLVKRCKTEETLDKQTAEKYRAINEFTQWICFSHSKMTEQAQV